MWTPGLKSSSMEGGLYADKLKTKMSWTNTFYWTSTNILSNCCICNIVMIEFHILVQRITIPVSDWPWSPHYHASGFPPSTITPLFQEAPVSVFMQSLVTGHNVQISTHHSWASDLHWRPSEISERNTGQPQLSLSRNESPPPGKDARLVQDL